jgi:cytochrome b561
MNRTATRFNRLARTLHWVMAAMILAMLFIGAGMMSTVSPAYHELFGWHRTIGIAVLVLVAIRLINRLLRGAPPLPADLPSWQRWAAKGSHILLYALMFAMPLLGWATLSAADDPVLIFGALQLPPITPPDGDLYAVLRATHRRLAYLLFAVWLGHFAAAIFHRFIRRDGVLRSMT